MNTLPPDSCCVKVKGKNQLSLVFEKHSTIFSLALSSSLCHDHATLKLTLSHKKGYKKIVSILYIFCLMLWLTLEYHLVMRDYGENPQQQPWQKKYSLLSGLIYFQVGRRIIGSMVPVYRKNYLVSFIRPNPDLYGKQYLLAISPHSCGLKCSLGQACQNVAGKPVEASHSYCMKYM